MGMRVCFTVLGVALAAYVAESAGVFGSGLDVLFDNWISNGILLGAALACLVRCAVRRDERAIWLVLGIALILWTGGDVMWSALWGNDPAPPYPSFADGLWLAFYPLCYLALALIVRSQRRARGTGLWLDGVIASLAVGAFGAALVFQPVFDATAGETAAIVTNLAYPLGDIALLALVAAVFGMGGWRPSRALLLLGAGFALSAVADGVYVVQVANGSEGTALLGPLWAGAAVLIALAAWQPAAASAPVRPDGLRVLLAPAAFALATIGLQASMFVTGVKPAAAALALATEIAVILRASLTFRDNLRILDGVRRDSLTDQLTGLGNRRRLMADLDVAIAEAGAGRPAVLALYDLDGFKLYNDTFGHPAGDALLSRLGEGMALALGDRGRAYRMGGDEFCALVEGDCDVARELVAVGGLALSEQGEGFSVTCSHGTVELPGEASDGVLALQLADQRMYGQKGSRRSSPSRQSSDVLLQVLREREPELGTHLSEVGMLASATARQLGIDGERLDEIVRAAELHDIGKMAVPDAILHKTGPLTESDWSYMRQHTLIGERILARAPALVPVARLVRSSHERFDGDGYPDALAGEDIPLGARIVAVCDAFHAMTSDRPYRPGMSREEALAELRACAGTQFDPSVVDGFVATLGHVPAAT
jgi:two-component system cell cycle response regulator